MDQRPTIWLKRFLHALVDSLRALCGIVVALFALTLVQPSDRLLVIAACAALGLAGWGLVRWRNRQTG